MVNESLMMVIMVINDNCWLVIMVINDHYLLVIMVINDHYILVGVVVIHDHYWLVVSCPSLKHMLLTKPHTGHIKRQSSQLVWLKQNNHLETTYQIILRRHSGDMMMSVNIPIPQTKRQA